MLGTTEGTSKSQFCRARGLLQKLIKTQFENLERESNKKIVKMTDVPFNDLETEIAEEEVGRSKTRH